MSDFVAFYLAKYTTPGFRTLDVGCGTSPYRNAVAGDYVGVDYTDSPFDSGEKIAVDVIASGCALPFRNDTFDLVFTRAALLLMPDPCAALREFFRVLRPGGRAVAFDYNRRTQRRLNRLDVNKRKYPFWTQWGLKMRFETAGFDAEILPPKEGSFSRIESVARLVHQEFFGVNAVVTGVKRKVAT